MRLAILILILFWNHDALAQLNGKYNFRNIDPSDGLLYSNIRGVGQDSRGFIWILSLNGLQRYDGSRFVNYPQITENSPYGSLSDCQLFMDTVHDQVNVIKWQQMDQLDLSANTFTSLSIKNFLAGNTNSKWEIFIDELHRRWTISPQGITVDALDSSLTSQSYVDIHSGNPQYGTNIIMDAKRGMYYIGGYDYFIIADLLTRKMSISNGPHPENTLLDEFWKRYGNDSRIKGILLDSYDNLWIVTWRHFLHRYNLDTKQFHTYSLKDIKNRQNDAEKGDLTLLVNAMYEDRQGQLWFATEFAGLLVYNREKDDFDFITSDEKIRNGPRYTYSINNIFQDRDDNIWLGTDRGISVFNPYRNYFQAIRHLDGNEASIPKNNISDIIQTRQGEILIATWGGGISVYDAQLNFLRNIKFKGVPELDLVWSLVEHDDGLIWAGTQQGYIHQYDPIKKSLTTIHPPETEHSTIIDMVKDRDGNIILGLHNGRITRWEKEKRKFYPMDGSSPKSFPYTAVVNMYVDRNNQCWVTTANGLLQYDSRSHTFSGFFLPDSIDVAIGVRMNGIEQFSDSTLVIGTVFRGIYVFNTRTGKFSRHSSDPRLTESSVFAIKKDDKENIWITTDYSLCKIIPNIDEPVIYNIDQGMIHTAFSSRSFIPLADGRWMTHTPAEVICFKPEKMEEEQKEIPRIEISGFKVADHSIYIDSFLQHNRPVQLAYNQNFISIEFSALNFLDLQQTNYYYRLTGVDKNWIHTTTRNFADYTDLKPGEYTFEVKADKGGISSRIISFPLIITPPWWGTWWFRAACFLALCTVIYVVLKKRIQIIHKESELKQKIAATEMMALRAQMNPHFIFNCLSSIDSLVQTNQKEEATTYLAKFALLIRTILENSKSNVIPCWKDMEALKLYLDLEALRWGNKIVCQMQVDPQIQEGDYKVPPMIIQPFVENAIHHGLLNKLGMDKKLEIAVDIDGDRLKYTITDNGVGRVKADEYKALNHGSRLPFGIQITEDRINLFNRDERQSVKITDLYNPAHIPAGTKVEVWLQMQSAVI